MNSAWKAQYCISGQWIHISPIQVLTKRNPAWLQRSDKIGYIQDGMTTEGFTFWLILIAPSGHILKVWIASKHLISLKSKWIFLGCFAFVQYSSQSILHNKNEFAKRFWETQIL